MRWPSKVGGGDILGESDIHVIDSLMMHFLTLIKTFYDHKNAFVEALSNSDRREVYAVAKNDGTQYGKRSYSESHIQDDVEFQVSFVRFAFDTTTQTLATKIVCRAANMLPLTFRLPSQGPIAHFLSPYLMGLFSFWGYTSTS